MPTSSLRQSGMEPDPREFRFRDEWLVPLLAGRSDVANQRVDQWRRERTAFLSQRLMDESVLSFAQLAKLIHDAYRIDSTELTTGVDETAARLIPEKIVRKHLLRAVREAPRQIDVAMANPLDENALADVRAVTGRTVNPLFCPPGILERAVLNAVAPDAVIYELLKKFNAETTVQVVAHGFDDVAPDSGEQPRAPVIQLANNIIANAVRMGASDIHIEHDETATQVRYRVDGLLRNALAVPRYVGVGPLVSRIKIMAGLDVSDRLRPQDGRAKLRVGNDTIGLRVSTLPARTGEKVVLRILNERVINVRMAELGFHPQVLERFTAMLASEKGIVLVTGPTGSGKTTTLYSALAQLHGETVNVVTVEDPIEYRLPDITQVQINEKQGMTFAAVLRSVLRQDPDIAMLGEIRDGETAGIATQAALTGHLLLSTLHTNDTVGAIARLADLGVERFKIASALIGVTAQRLVRRVCPACAAPADTGEIPGAVRAEMERLYGRVAQTRGAGCNQCGFSGFKGRLPLIELLEVGHDLRDAIANGAGDEQLRKLAVNSGALHTIEADALWHVLEGRTTFEQVQPHLEMRRVEDAARAPGSAARTAAPARPAPAPQRDVERDTTDERLDVLVAVSDPIWRVVLEAALPPDQFSVSWVASGTDALAAVARRRPGLLIVAAELAGLSGEQVIRGVRTVIGALDVATIGLLSAENAAARDALSAAGADDVMAPPVDRDQLHARIEALLSREKGWSSVADVATPPVPVREAERLAALDSTGLFGSPSEERFDRFTREVTERLGVPWALISLVGADGLWHKSIHGPFGREFERNLSFCGHGINHEDIMVVEDAMLDPRFSENPAVTGDPGVRFYAGCPIHTANGQKIGTLCAIDDKPRALSDEQSRMLRSLTRELEAEIAS
ncbi:MAG TPA: ATPase, T2SS/T4P/T4SS family [Gemmatimonadaceae bacterium]|nr:ATPase, T2SS/T4P/T4SS family [Gemmatimonadaceae bacterium]